MNRVHVVPAAVALFLSACVIKETPPANSQPQPAPGTAATPAPAPTAAPGTAAPAPTTTPGTTTAPPAGTPPPAGMPAGMPTGMPTGMPGMPGMPAPGGTTAAPGGGLVLPGVCVPIGSWSKKFDNGLPSTGTVTIASPVIFNQFPVTDGVIVAGMPAGTLKGTGAMTSTNDLSIDVTNGAFVLSYTCHFAADCKTGKCTVTKGGLGGFSLNKQ